VIYNEKANLLIARVNVRLRESNEEVLLAECVELTRDLKEGVLQEVRYLVADKSRLAAVTARRSEEGSKTTFTQGVYSPCYPCETDKNRSSARSGPRSSWEKNYGNICAHGIPWRSHFLCPLPKLTNRRSSGFLAPTFTAFITLGTSIGIPYYWAINEISDLILTPFILTKQGALLGAQYQHRWVKVALNLTGSMSGTKPVKFVIADDEIKKI
jgi:LPS-assembly protein